ncbi:MAG: CHASE2 domain-containing protein [Pseudomonadota bacterium]|nr:CHASE2 domain-containing protein [Pseudomonadota bacterium]
MAIAPASMSKGGPDTDPWYRFFWVPIAALVLAWLAAQTPLHDRLTDAIGDVGMRWVARPAQFDELVIVDIDDASLQALAPQLGDWPFRRDTYALLLDFLRDAGARAVVFDIVFGGPRQGDDLLARSITKRSDVVLAASGMKQTTEDSAATRLDIDRLSTTATPDNGATRWPAMSIPSQPLLAALDRPGALGVISTPLDADGRLRRLPLAQQVDTRVLPSLPVAGLLVGMDEAARTLSYSVRELRVGEHRWPVDAQGRAHVMLPANDNAVRTLSFESVMRAALGAEDDPALRASLDGRTVYVGSSAFLGDDVITPLGPRSGTALLAMAHGALARDQVLRPVSTPVQALLMTMALLPCVALWRRGRPALAGDGIAALLAIAAILAVGAAWLRGGWQWIDAVTPLSVVAFGFLLSVAAQLRWTMQANRQLVHERAVAEAANQAKSDFLASVSHEIRTPLNAVLGMAEVLSRTDLTAEQRRYVDVFRSSGATLCNLIDDLLDLSKIEAGKLELERSVFSLHELLDDQMALLMPLAEARQLALTWHIDDGVGPRIEGDRQRLTQAIVNLVGNAIKFTHQGGVSIDVHRVPSGRVRFEISDTGIGIASSKFELIFQPFTQADGGVTRSYGGTGLGLSITKSLVELMGGRISVESRPGIGSTFRFTIDAPLVAGVAASPPVGANPAGSSTRSSMTAPPAPRTSLATAESSDDAPKLPILLVDDNDVNLIVTEALLRDTGYPVELARSGEAAIGKFISGRYGLVMMDVQMPGMDGLAATREIRRIEVEEGRARTPVVALTANAFESDERRSLEAGCDGHLTKPLSRQRLIDAVVAMATCGRPQGHTASAVMAETEAGREASPPAAPMVDVALSVAALAADSVETSSALFALNGDTVLYQRLLAHARVFMGSWSQDLATALNAADAAPALRLAHDLQSIAARIGAHPLADAAGSLDAALRFGDLEGVQRARALISQRLQEALLSPSLAGDQTAAAEVRRR